MRPKSMSPSFAFAAVLAAAALAATGVWAQQPAPEKKPARQRVVRENHPAKPRRHRGRSETGRRQRRADRPRIA